MTRYLLLMISLPDVNILLALVAAGHTHHESARKWFEMQAPDTVAICRVTQMGLLRLLTNPKVLPAGVFSIERAWEIADEILADKRVFFELEPTGLDASWIGMMRHKAAGASSWTDAYLAAFADGHGYEMVTFDRGFARWSQLTLNLLARPSA